MSKKSMSHKSIPKIGTKEFAEDVQKAFSDIYEILADKYTEGDKSDLAEHVAYACIVIAEKKELKDFMDDETSFEAVLGSVSGKGIHLLKMAGVISNEIASARSEETGINYEKSLSVVLAKIHEFSSSIMTEGEVEKIGIGSTEVSKFKEVFRDEGLKFIKDFIEKTKKDNDKE